MESEQILLMMNSHMLKGYLDMVSICCIFNLGNIMCLKKGVIFGSRYNYIY